MENKKNPSASALVTALFLTGILTFALMAVSALLVDAIRRSGEHQTALRAFYFAEAGIERGLFELRTHDVGFETEGSEGEKFSYSVSHGDVSGEDFIRLALHETATIPLLKAKRFTVEFFTKSSPSKNVDILEWKIYGGAEALTDTVPVLSPGNSEEQPSCFGTDGSELCSLQSVTVMTANGDEILCTLSQARKRYQSETSAIEYCTPIHAYLAAHTDAILVLRNIFNPLLTVDGNSDIFYRVRTFGDVVIPATAATVTGTANIGDVTQKISARVPSRELLPAFEFALYGK